jgi:hypothetical protein
MPKRKATVGSGARRTKKTKHAAKDPSPAASPSPSPPPKTFWDGLQKVWLTPRALDELDRQTADMEPPFPRRANPAHLSLPVADLRALKRFARHGGPDLTDLRNFPDTIWDDHITGEPTRPVPPPRVNAGNIDIGAYDRNFQDVLVNNGVLGEAEDGPNTQRPANWTAINERMRRRRDSLSSDMFGRIDHEQFRRTDALTERGGNPLFSVVQSLQGGNRGISSAERGTWENLAPLVVEEPLAPQPESYDARRALHVNGRVRQALASLIVPSTGYPMRVLPNFAVSAKKKTFPADNLRLVALHAGAHGARAMHQMQMYGAEGHEPHDNKAYTIGATYHDRVLRLYTIHPTPSTNPTKRATDYQMNELGAWAVGRTPEAFREGASAFRNLREWADEMRAEFVDKANRTVARGEVADILV